MATTSVNSCSRWVQMAYFGASRRELDDCMSSGYNINARFSWNSRLWTALELSVFNGHVSYARELLKCGASSSIRALRFADTRSVIYHELAFCMDTHTFENHRWAMLQVYLTSPEFNESETGVDENDLYESYLYDMEKYESRKAHYETLGDEAKDEYIERAMGVRK